MNFETFGPKEASNAEDGERKIETIQSLQEEDHNSDGKQLSERLSTLFARPLSPDSKSVRSVEEYEETSRVMRSGVIHDLHTASSEYSEEARIQAVMQIISGGHLEDVILRIDCLKLPPQEELRIALLAMHSGNSHLVLEHLGFFLEESRRFRAPELFEGVIQEIFRIGDEGGINHNQADFINERPFLEALAEYGVERIYPFCLRGMNQESLPFFLDLVAQKGRAIALLERLHRTLFPREWSLAAYEQDMHQYGTILQHFVGTGIEIPDILLAD